MEESVRRSKDYISGALNAMLDLGAGRGPMNHGFVLYRYLMNVDFLLGNTLPDMVITAVLCVVVHKVIGLTKKTA